MINQFALFRLPDGRAWLGEGPFEALAEAPADGPAFYWNDFDLSDATPWRRPARLIPLSPETSSPWTDLPWPRVNWRHPSTEYFEMAFRRIRRDVIARRLEKMVPVLTEHGLLVEGRWERLLERVLTAPAGFWGYACVDGDHGFAGATPELLFHAEGAQVETMAPAGTAKPGTDEDFGVNLGTMAARGEIGVLIVNLDFLMRIASNPFYPYLNARVMEGVPGPATGESATGPGPS